MLKDNESDRISRSEACYSNHWRKLPCMYIQHLIVVKLSNWVLKTSSYFGYCGGHLLGNTTVFARLNIVNSGDL